MFIILKKKLLNATTLLKTNTVVPIHVTDNNILVFETNNNKTNFELVFMFNFLDNSHHLDNKDKTDKVKSLLIDV